MVLRHHGEQSVRHLAPEVRQRVAADRHELPLAERPEDVRRMPGGDLDVAIRRLAPGVLLGAEEAEHR